ncbi:hypothetical protein [Streptomyces sp. NPDC059165]|uniref:hypothetical protein n=1 Tax=Streptomyces sp. NPDC059165 TaxID=3346751 RepID=UPI00368F4A3F
MLHRTGAPRWVIAGVLLLNTVLVVVLQVRASRGTDEPGPAARAARGGALCIAVACVVFSLTEGVSAVTASVLLFLGAIAHVLGEVRQAAGSWGISFGLAPEDAQGQYQGTASMGADIGRMIAPAVLTWLAIEYGTFGWLVMAVGFAAVGAALPPVGDHPRLLCSLHAGSWQQGARHHRRSAWGAGRPARRPKLPRFSPAPLTRDSCLYAPEKSSMDCKAEEMGGLGKCWKRS